MNSRIWIGFNLLAGAVALLLLANMWLGASNRSLEREITEMRQQNQRDEALVAQTRDATSRVLLYLRSIAIRFDRAAQSDASFGEMLKEMDQNGAYARLQTIIRQSAAAARDAQNAGGAE